MQLVTPMPYEEAVRKIGAKTPIGSDLSSSQWGDVPVGLRERAFFSSRIESVRFLQRARDRIADYLQGAHETLMTGETALAMGSRQEFVKQMQDFLKAEGVQRAGGDLKDITSQRRLGLIFDVNTRAAQDYGYWRQGQDPDVLDEWPAQRFIRVIQVKEPRNLHVDAEDQVRLKSDLKFWLMLNHDFNVPWGPWGWGCGHDVEDVDRAEAEQLGIIKPGEAAKPVEKDFNDHLEASTKTMDLDMVKYLEDSFGDQVEFVKGAARWNPGAKPKQPWQQPAPKVTLPEPVPPPPITATPTLDTVLKTVGIDPQAPITTAQAKRLVDELKENHPLHLSQVIQTVNAPLTGPLSRTVIASVAQEVLDLFPPSIAKTLPKLSLSLSNQLQGALGDYHPGTGNVRIAAHSTRDEARSTIFHEMMHWFHMDGVPAYKDAIRKHFRVRTAGEVTKPLPGYSGRGRLDKWYEAYAGKIYSQEPKDGEGLEMVTRYFQLLANPDQLAKQWNHPVNGAAFRETMQVVLRGLFA
jgi:hypothetical protein